MTKPSYIANNNVGIIRYYCTNHRLNTDNKKLLFGKTPCDGQIEFDRGNNKFYITYEHNMIYNKLNIPIHDNEADINIEIKKRSDFKKILIEFLNKHPLYYFTYFKKFAKKLYLKGKYEFKISKNAFANIFYPWRQTAKIFSWFSIFDNSKAKDNTIYLKDVENKYIYNDNPKDYYWHRHLCWMSNFNTNSMRLAKHFYIDFTYLATKEYYQLCIIMYFDETLYKKIQEFIY